MYKNGKMIPVETSPEIGMGDEREWWRAEFKYDIF
jgi:hypothetical protein